MKKFLTRALLLALSLTLLAGCGRGKGDASSDSEKNVDLSAFAQDEIKKYESMGLLSKMDDEVVDTFYPELKKMSEQELLVYMCERDPAPVGDFVLVKAASSEDVDTVKQLLQDRINYMVGDGNGPGGAWYPEPTEMWENQSRIVANGNYVMLVVSEDCEKVVEDFNALF